MPGKIYLIQDDKTLQALSQQPYPNEDDFQSLLERYPDLLAGDQMNEAVPRRWLLVAREMGVPGEEGGVDQWSLDHLFLDQDGVPTLVEVKRRSDTRIRREVVGQMLDYAANAVVYWPVETVRARFETSCENRKEDPVQLLVERLGVANDEAAVDAFWTQVKTNLQAARIRLVFVADEVPPELRRIVEFLNATMDPVEVLAVEIHQYVGQGLKTLVPRVMGQTIRKSTSLSPKGRIWDEQTFFKELAAAHSPDVVNVARRILEWSQACADVTWGRAPINGAFFAVVQYGGKKYPLFAVWNWVSSTPPNAYFEIQGTQLRARAPFDDPVEWQELCRRLGEFWPRSLASADAIKLPQASLAHFTDDDRLQALFRVLEWAADRIREEPIASSEAGAL